jgi:hypothetical protein
VHAPYLSTTAAAAATRAKQIFRSKEGVIAMGE